MLHSMSELRGGGGGRRCKFSETWNMHVWSFLLQVVVPLCMFLLYKNASAYFMTTILVSQDAGGAVGLTLWRHFIPLPYNFPVQELCLPTAGVLAGMTEGSNTLLSSACASNRTITIQGALTSRLLQHWISWIVNITIRWSIDDYPSWIWDQKVKLAP
jgi:hypothetical protein